MWPNNLIPKRGVFTHFYKAGIMFFHRIHYRIISLFVILVIAILFISGRMLHWTIRQSLEAEVGRKLMAVANAVSVQFEEEEIGFLVEGIGSRTKTHLLHRLLRMKKATQVKRIFLFDMEGKSLLDTEQTTDPGNSYFRLQFYRTEIEEIKKGRSAHSILFQGIDKEPTMTGFAPLLQNEQFVGGVGVDGSISFLGAVFQMRERLYRIGIAAAFVAVILGLLMARTITGPLWKLVKASRQIGQGDVSEPVPSLGKGEIGLLAQTMEEMRNSVIERERELKTMLAGVAHEIRNPLGGIELFAGLLSDEVAQNKNATAHMERITSEVTHLKEIVNSFLDYARPQEPSKENFLLREVLFDVRLLLENELKTHNIILPLPKDTDDATVFADPEHVKRILLNLIRNAIQAMPDGGKMHIRWEKTDHTIELYLKDEGRGIPQEIRDKIFTPFFTTRDKGTGLGLSIVKGLIEANDGTIRLASSDKKGTEFVVSLPKSKPVQSKMENIKSIEKQNSS